MKSILIDNFRAGLNTRDAAARLKKGMCSDADNVIIDETSIGSRLGQSTFASYPAAPHSIFDYANVNSGVQKIMIGASDKLYADGTEIATGLSGNPLSFAVLNSVLYISDGVNKIKAYDGTTVSELASAPNALAIAAHRGCLIAIGQVGAKNLLQWSDTNDPSTWPSDRTASIQDGDPDGIVGVEEYLHQLAVFKRTAVYLMDGFPSPTGWFRLPTDKGCVSRESLRVIDQGLIWRGEIGAYRLANGEVGPVSSLLGPTFANLNPVRRANSYAVVHDDRYYLTAATAGSNSENMVLVLDLRSGGWTVWRTFESTVMGLLPVGSGSRAVFVGKLSGDVVRVNYGGTDIGGSGYRSHIRLAPIEFSQEVTIAQVDLVLSDLGDIRVDLAYLLDNGKYASPAIPVLTSSSGAAYDISAFDISIYGEATTTLHSKRIGGTCRKIEFDISTSGANKPWMLHALRLHYIPGGW